MPWAVEIKNRTGDWVRFNGTYRSEHEANSARDHLAAKWWMEDDVRVVEIRDEEPAA